MKAILETLNIGMLITASVFIMIISYSSHKKDKTIKTLESQYSELKGACIQVGKTHKEFQSLLERHLDDLSKMVEGHPSPILNKPLIFDRTDQESETPNDADTL